MKIVQSFWSKPFFCDATTRNNGGWLEKKHGYMSWALSSLQLAKFYDDLELWTDELGYQTIIEKLELPYKNVHIALDDVNYYPKNLWAAGKLYTYSLQREPFIHVDGDVFIFRKFSERIEVAPLVAQNRLLIDTATFDEVAENVVSNFIDAPAYLRKDHDALPVRIYNSGIFGGHDIASILAYASDSLSFADANLDMINRHIDFLTRDPDTSFGINALDCFNSIMESYLFTAFASDLKVECLLDDAAVSTFRNAQLIEQSQASQGYTHPIYHHKKDPTVCAQVEYKLKQGFPHYYYKIIALLEGFQI